MKVQKKKSRTGIRIALLSVLLASSLATASVFMGVNAAEVSVSPTDETLFQPVGIADRATEEEEAAEDSSEILSEESTDAEETAETPDGDEEVAVQDVTPDFVDMTASDIMEFVTGRFKPSAQYDGNFRSELLDNEKKIYDAIKKNFVDEEKNTACTVDITQFGYTTSDEAKVRDAIISAAAAFSYDHPEAFWIRSFGYALYSSGDKYTTVKIDYSTPAYTNAYSDLSKVKTGIASAVSSIKSSRKSESRYDTLKAIHDYICNNASYDYDAANYGSAENDYGSAYTATPLFGGGSRGKQFVCEGYAKSFKILAEKFNIPCVLVSGTAKTSSGGGNHMWNYVQMDDGNWYGVDVTWDDQSIIHYDYFLVGKNSVVFNSNKFSQDHLPLGQIMVTDTMNPLVYPTLSNEAFDPSVSVESITLNKSSVNVTIGESFTLLTFIEPDTYSGEVKWTSSNTKVITVTSKGLVKAVGVGTATVTASVGSVSAQCTVNVTRTVSLNKSSLSLTITRSKPNPTATLTAKISGGTIGKTWYSDTPAVATVTSAGKVTAVKEGTAKIYCKTADGIESEPCVVTVVSLIIHSENANSIIDNVAYVTEKGTCKLLVPGIKSGVTWKSSNAKIASVNSTTGEVTGVKKGTVTITATAADGTKDTIKLTVYKATETLSLNAAKVNVYSNGTFTLKATLSKNANDPVTWSSSNTSVATVTSKGVVKGLKPGTATITAKTFSGKTASAVVTVRTKATAIVFEQVASAVLVGGNTGTFTAKITAPAGCNDSITWTSSSKAVATVTATNDGRTATVKGLKKGTTTITAKTGSGKKVTYKVTVVNAPADSIKITNGNVSLYTGASATLKTQVTPKTSNDLVTWSTSDSSVVTVDQKGKIKGLKQGTATVYATTQFGKKKAEVTVTVCTKAKSVSVNRTSAAVKVGETVTLNVTAITPDGCNDTLKWTTSSKAVASIQVSPDGKSAVVTGIKKGTATVTVKTGSGKSQRIKVTVSN